MSKVFTITEGLENLGAMRTGGQGSVYKARRTGTMITAVKLLPTPIHTEDPNNKNYRDFTNEVEKLKKVNETPNPNVVRILSSGVTDTGSFPFIEMEFIEGPDLEELLQPPHDPVFTIKEALRVAEHLAHALAHCHRMDIKHGDVKSNNVKYNIHTGNYVLLDFGLAIMSDEQRRTSLRQAGAVEFMAPEQGNGTMLFQSDIYSFGIIIYELLAGRVPFPLPDRSETSRNSVLVAHMETPPPDLLQLREAHLPSSWPEDRREHELRVPLWVLNMLRKCLQKDPSARFANGTELHEYIHLHSVRAMGAGSGGNDELVAQLRRENKKLREEKEQLQQVVQRLQQTIAAGPSGKAPAQQPLPPPPVRKKSSWSGLLSGLIIGGVITFLFWFLVLRDTDTASTVTSPDSTMTTAGTGAPGTPKGPKRRSHAAIDTYHTGSGSQQDPGDQTGTDPNTANPGDAGTASGTQYLVRAPRAYFHDRPDRNTRRDAYLVPSDAILNPLAEEGDFIYVEFTNSAGQTSKGWVLKEDLMPAE